MHHNELRDECDISGEWRGESRTAVAKVHDEEKLWPTWRVCIHTDTCVGSVRTA